MTWSWKNWDGAAGRMKNYCQKSENFWKITRLLGAMLGYDTSGSLHRYRVERGGYSFPMMSYADKKMRNMQLFFIESELEQAVGRARLLRENCTVYVFSNYPCQQAEIIENPYLRVKTEEDIEKNEDEIIQNETMEY